MASRNSALTVPRTQLQTRTERVLDVRCCVLSGCRFLQTARGRDGKHIRTCGAHVFRAMIPAEPLAEEVRRNPSPVPGAGSDTNPFLQRLLMSTDCLRPECGVAEITRSERVLVIDQEELESELFAR